LVFSASALITETIVEAFDTSRLRLRPMSADDQTLYCHLYTDGALMQHIAAPLSMEAAQRSFVSACAQQSHDRQHWIIQHRDGDKDIGLVALFAKDAAAEIGVMLIAGVHGRGMATESMQAIVDRAFAEGSLRLLWIRQQVSNVPVVAMMQRLGFARLPTDNPDAVEVRWDLSRKRWVEQRATMALRQGRYE
jgi:RimJ/RimL family protein N-acetyltransferase